MIGEIEANSSTCIQRVRQDEGDRTCLFRHRTRRRRRRRRASSSSLCACVSRWRWLRWSERKSNYRMTQTLAVIIRHQVLAMRSCCHHHHHHRGRRRRRRRRKASWSSMVACLLCKETNERANLWLICFCSSQEEKEWGKGRRKRKRKTCHLKTFTHV